MIRRTVLVLVVASASLFAHAEDEAKAPPPAAPTAGQNIAGSLCVGCHGADGNSMIPTNPILAGQVKEYIYKQLTNFKAGEGKPALRNNPIMGGMVAALPDDDMKSLAAWFSGQSMKPASAKDEALVAVGRKLWRGGDQGRGIPACAGCHGAAGAGLPALFPRVAGQYPDYTEAQLKQFRTGERANDPEKMMQMIAAKMNDHDIKAVAEYMAGLR